MRRRRAWAAEAASAQHARQRGGSWFNAATARVLHRPHLREGDDVPLVSVPPSAPQSTATGAVGVSSISSVDDIIITTTTTGALSSLAMPGVPARLALRRRRAEPSLLSFRELLEHRHASALGTLDGLLLLDELLAICQPHAPTSARLPGIPVRRRQLAGPRPTQQPLVSQVQQLRGPAHGLHSRMVLGSHDVHRIRCATAILVAFLATGETLPRAIDARDSPGPASPTRRRHRGALLGLTFAFTVARSAATW